MRKQRTGIVRPRKTSKGGSDRALIRELFAERMPFYGYGDVLRLTRSTEAEFVTAVMDGDLEPLHDGGDVRFAWEDVAALALTRWTPRVIARALGRTRALSRLNDLQELVVRLPVYQIRLLQALTEEECAT